MSLNQRMDAIKVEERRILENGIELEETLSFCQELEAAEKAHDAAIEAILHAE